MAIHCLQFKYGTDETFELYTKQSNSIYVYTTGNVVKLDGTIHKLQELLFMFAKFTWVHAIKIAGGTKYN